MQQRNFFLTLLMATVMMVLSPQIMRAAVETVTVGEGTSLSNQVPYGNLYKNSTSQMLYAADEIGKKSIIQKYADGEWIIPTDACPHQLIEHAAVTNTCGDDGNTLYYECSICHHYFSDAAAENEMEENSWVIPADPSQHEFTGNYDNNGFGQCAVCNKALYNIYMPAEYDDEENCFHIYNVGQLYWFADKVNNGTPSDEGYPFNAEVYGDLVVNSNVLTDEGELNGDGSNFLAWTPIDNYQGVFNGAGHTIKGLYGGVGLFNNNNGTVTRIYIEDSYFEGVNLVGGIVAYNAGTVENSLSLATVKGNSNVGGLVGFNAGNGVVKNCYSRATVKAETTDATRSGKVVGYNEGTLANCYYLSDVADQQETEHPTVISKTAEQFASGEVAWLLNGEKVDETSVWGQFLGNDYAPAAAFPRPSMWNSVWKGYMCFDDSLQYANHHLHAEPNHDHVYGNGICEVCGAYQTPESQTTGGVQTFDIANYGNALYVAKYTNEGNTCAARLVVPKVMMTGPDAYLTISNGTLTLDLNGDTLTTNNSQVILVAGGDVTIHDSSANGTGAVINGSSHGVNAQSGSLTITGGTFIGSGFAVLTSSSCTSLAISGGKYYATSGISRLYTPGKSALAPDYSYYNIRTGEELKDYTNQPIYAELFTDTIIVKQASVKAVLTKNGENINYRDFNSAFAAAQQCTADDNATLKLMKNRTMPSSEGYITLSSGTFTLDLNGDTISNYHGQTILVSGANLTITDSSKGQNGALINSGSYAVNITGGSLTVLAGNLIARNTAPALNVGSSSPTVSLKGGKYMSNNTYGYRVYTYGKSLLAPDYSYYNLSTDEELNDITSGYLKMSNIADTLIVKQGSVKAVLTKNGEDTNYYDFNSAFAAAQQCTTDDNATLKLMKNRTMANSEGYITLSSGTFTLDLNGDTISNTNQTTILVSGANLTITDSSKGQNGALINSGSYAVNITGGSLTVLAGNLIARNTAPALYVGSSSPTVSLKGGKYMSNNTYGYRVYTYGKSLLAPGYSYYNLRTDEEMTDITSGYLEMSNTADTLIVKQGSVKAVLTKNGEDTNYYDFNSAFAAAQQCTADDNATLKLMKNCTIPSSERYITLSSGTFTLDLNGDTISNSNSQTILVSGANLTITDSSKGQNGALINSGSFAVNITGGSLTVLAGNLIARNTAPALYVGSSSPTVSLKGGKYMSNSTYGSRIYTYGKSLLAPGYSYYNLSTDEEMNDVTSGYISMSNTADTLIVKQGSVKAILTKGDEVTTYYDFNAAFTAAQQCKANEKATLKLMQNYAIPDNKSYITLSSGVFTLDLNGDTISIYNAQTILVSGANLTITDSSEGQKGALINRASSAVNVTDGSLTVLGGNIISRASASALNVGSSSPTVSLKGGKYMSNSTYGNRIYTYGKSLLAPGYSYYNLRTDEEMTDVTSGYISMSNTADTLIVKQGSVKAILTKGDEVTTYKDFNSAFAAAQQCTASDNATLKLMQNRTMPSSEGYITLSSGTFTLDLNGDTISNTNQTTILVSGANLTITDSSKGQNGALINRASSAVNVTDGSLTVLGGNIISRASASALFVDSSTPTVSLKGGKYMSNDTYGYRVYTYGKSLLAPGYSYYNLRTDEEMTDITNGSLAMSNIADTLVVKLGSDKMALTKGDNITIYKDINAAFAAAQQCTASDYAVLKLLKNVTLPTGNGYITLTDGAFTLDLNGDTLGIKGDWVLKLNGTDLTVTDSSEDKKGALVNTASIVVYAVNGSLTMQSGNLKGKGDYSIYNNEGGMDITLLSGSYSGGMQYHANSTLNLPNVAMFDTEGNEIALKYTEYVDYNCYRTEEPFTVNPYYTVGDLKGKLTKVDNKYFADKLTLVDGMPFNSEYDFTAAEAEYSRTMTTKWGTICLPFDVTVSSVTDKTEEGYQPFDFYYVDDINDDVMTLNKETQKVSAGIGMILRHDGTGGEVSIKETNVEVSSNAACASNATDLWGTFTSKTINSGYYIANDKFWNAANLDEGAVVPPYRAYVEGSGWAAAKGISIFDPEEETTGVTTVTADKADADAWYTLDGVKLGAKPNKAGIYIHGGKKVAVK